MTTKPIPSFRLDCQNVRAVTVRANGKLWKLCAESNEALNMGAEWVSGYIEESEGDKFFLCWVADCFDPPLRLVRGANSGDACEYFEEYSPLCEVSEHSIPDDNDDDAWEHHSYNKAGKVIRTDNIECIECELVSVEF